MRSGAVIIPGAKVALVGEAWGADEEKAQLPFQGYSGRLLNRILSQAGLCRDECTVTNVVCARPPANDFSAFCVPHEVGRTYNWPFNVPLTRQPRTLYLAEKYHEGVLSLIEEVRSAKVVIPLGNTALWAMTAQTPSIGKYRGVWIPWAHGSPGPKLLPTYHPAAVTREYSLFVVAVADMMKAKRGLEVEGIVRPARKIWIAPDVYDLQVWHDIILKNGETTLDIEVDKQDLNNLYISCIGFGTSPWIGYVVPFVRRDGRHYWETTREELAAWDMVRSICEAEHITKILHRLIYDQYVLARFAGIRLRGRLEDSLVAHHALYPELPKSLAFIGSILTEEPAWKLERDTKDPKREE